MHTIDKLIAKYLIFICVILVLYVFWRLPDDRRKRFAFEAIAGGILALALAKIGGKFFYDTRPFVAGHFTPYFPHGNDNGFPSDHTLLSAFLGFLVLKYDKRWGYILLTLAAIIGLSRVVAGVHHFVDILGSFAFAGLAVALVTLAEKKLLKRNAYTAPSRRRNSHSARKTRNPDTGNTPPDQD